MTWESAHYKACRSAGLVLPRAPRRHRLATLVCAVVFSLGVVDLPTGQGQEQNQRKADGLWVRALDIAGGESRPLFRINDFESVDAVSVSPDGRQIAVAGRRPDERDTEFRIRVAHIDGSEPRDAGRGTMPTWSPGGGRIAFSRQAPEPGVWMMRADGSDQQIIDQAGHSPCWSPDGRMIAYTRRVRDCADFVIFNLVEGEFRAVWGDGSSGYESLSREFAWSPDSTRLGFHGSLPGGERHLASVTVMGESSVQIHDRDSGKQQLAIGWRDNDTMLTWSAVDSQVQIRVIDMEGSTGSAGAESSMPARRTLPIRVFGQSISSIDLSGDRRTLYYVSPFSE